ncbi:pentapeptide repeat-containing protein [Anabaena sp. CCY 0017]|uniref:pentapeptide repeat-containing protein n=1 Tax=Anabaena sp. CCY 0017 TaxID=3103866 RepID=UPI0039C5EA12
MHQNFSGKNLRGRSFKGQNLEGSDFSYADIRGANFTGANLQNANFSHAQCGLQKRWAIFLVSVSWFFSAIYGSFSAFTGYLISLIFDSSTIESQVTGWTALIVVIMVFIVMVVQRVNSAIALAIAIVGAIAIAFTIAGTRNIAIALAIAIVGDIAFGGAFAFAIVFTGTGAIVIAIAGAIAIAGTLFSAYIAWRAMKDDEKYSLIQESAVAFAAFGGTSFRCADLTDANFTQATLKNTDLRKATLIRTCFHKTRKLNWSSFVRV